MKYKCSKYNIVKKMNDGNYVLYNTRLMALASCSLKEYEYYKNLPGLIDNINEPFLRDLYECGYLIDSECDEIKILKYRLNNMRYSSNTLRLIIALTMECNFACSYCYEKNNKDSKTGKMSSSIQKALLEFIYKRALHCEKLEIVWYGGEPLLCQDVIESLSASIISFCNTNNIIYDASIITNGYLLNKHSSDFLKKNKIEMLQVTIDGNEQIHNKRRPLKNGTQTYFTIIKNILPLQNDFHIVVRSNIDKSNVVNIENMFNSLKEMGLKNFTFSAAPTVGDNVNSYSEQEFADVWCDINEMANLYGIDSGQNIIPTCANFCDADSNNSFVIDNDGYLYKCWHHIGEKRYSIAQLGDDLEEINRSCFYEFMTYDATEDYQCKNCVYLPICMGGCPYNRINQNERCTRYKYVLERIINKLWC